MKPDQFKFHIGGFFGDSVMLQYDGEGFRYLRSPVGPIPLPIEGKNESRGELIQPSESDYQLLKSVLDEINVWDWSETYDSDVMDGTQWEWLFHTHPEIHVHVNQRHHDRDPEAHRHGGES